MSVLALPRFRAALWTAMFVAALVVAVLNLRFLWIDIRKVFHHSVEHLGKRDFSLYLHLFTSPAVLVIGALLFHKGLRSRFRGVHRWLGRAYVVTILATSLATLHLSFHDTGGALGSLSFGILSVAWFGTAALAWIAAVEARYEDHSVWMVRNYALTLTNLTFRIDLHALLLLGAGVNSVYDPVRALQPVQNLLVAEFLLRSGFFVSVTWGAWGERIWALAGRRARPTSAPLRHVGEKTRL